jgi:hypothetical protein
MMRKTFTIQKIIIDGVLPERCGKCWLSVRSPHPAFTRICVVANGAITPLGESSGRPDFCPLELYSGQKTHVSQNCEVGEPWGKPTDFSKHRIVGKWPTFLEGEE